MREFRPHVVTTYDENGGYPHPDHIMCHNVSVVAFDAAGDPDRYPGTGDPWQPLKLYYNQGFSKDRFVALHEAMLAAGLESPYAEWLEKWDEDRAARDRTDRVTTRVVCDAYFGVRDEALKAHATQVDPDGFWFRVPMSSAAGGLADRGVRAGPVVRGHRRRRRTTCSPASGRRSAAWSRPRGRDRMRRSV